MRRFRRVALTALLILGWSVPRAAQAQVSPEMRAHFIDVGQGASTLFEFPCGAILVDTGSEKSGWFSRKFDGSKRLLDYLDTFFDRRTDLNHTLDLLLITHPHIDHTRTIPQLLSGGAIKILGVVTNGGPEGSSGSSQQKNLVEFASTHNLRRREIRFETVTNAGEQTDGTIDPLSCDDVDPKISVLWGQIGEDPGWGVDSFDNRPNFEDQNNHSVVVRVEFGAASFLITGDLEVPAIRSLVQRYTGSGRLDVDVYQVGHHGSSNGSSQALLDAASPKAAVIAAGPHCRKGDFTAHAHGHPRKLIVRKVSEAVQLSRDQPVEVQVATAPKTFEPFTVSKRVYSTGWDGTVVVTARADGWLDVAALGQSACP